MTSPGPQPCALFSVPSDVEVVSPGRALVDLGWRIVATEDAARELAHAGVEVLPLSELTGIDEGRFGFPPTLHPIVERMLTCESDAAERIDLVFEVPYHGPGLLDVGGHSLLALAIKGKRTVATSSEDLERLVTAFQRSGSIPEDLRHELHEIALDAIITFYSQQRSGDTQDPPALRSHLELLNGENPYQVPSHHLVSTSRDPLSLHRFELHAGERPCFTNLADLDNVVHALCRAVLSLQGHGLDGRVAIAAKHGNPCGMAIDLNDPGAALAGALWGDPTAVWGGELVVNFSVDLPLARELISSEARRQRCGSRRWMLDVIAAPVITDYALELLLHRRRTKVFVNPALATPSMPEDPWMYRWVRGGALRQPVASALLVLDQVSWLGDPCPDRLLDLVVAWTCAYNANHGGNEIALAQDGRLIGTGGGPSTVEAARIAVSRGQRGSSTTRGAVFVADAFFPFTDAPDILLGAGCSCGLVPSGGRRETEIRELFTTAGCTLGLLPPEQRGFHRH